MASREPQRKTNLAVAAPPQRFAFYAKLSRKNQAEYRRSDAKATLDIPNVYPLRAFLPDIQMALEDVNTRSLRRSAQALVSLLLEQFDAPSVEVRVLKVRPNNDEYELHGLYEHEEGKRPVIRVWAKTAAHKRPVAFKTFVRTLLHEVVHHFDFALFDLPNSFHTHGFYKRESHLARQLLDLPPAQKKATAAAVVVKKLKSKEKTPGQLSLFDAREPPTD